MTVNATISAADTAAHLADAASHVAEAAHGGVDLVTVVSLLAAAVIAVPLFKRLGLGSVIGYLVAGLVLGPSGLAIVGDPQSVLHAAEIGVVMFLFIIGLEMEPSRLWAMRKQIFGLGAAQVAAAGVLMTGLGLLLGLAPAVAFIFGMGFVLTSTAIVMQFLGEKNMLGDSGGQKMVSVLLFEDLLIVPLLAIIAILAPGGGEVSLLARLTGFAVAIGAVALLIFLGRRIMNPLFGLLASAKVREVMTAAALLVVLGAALLMQASGLSMAMGAFLAGVLLSTSTFRHQLEADIEPFRGILLGLFFLAVGMSLDMGTVLAAWPTILLYVVCYMAVKIAAIYLVARLTKSGHRQALERAMFMAQGGEFAFVLFATASAAGLIGGPQNAVFTAAIIVSMVLTPFTIMSLKWLLPKVAPSMDGIAEAEDLEARILLIGFGRFGQIVSQSMLGKGHSISIIDTDVEMIRAAAHFGFKVHFGDGARLDILHAAGAGKADIVLICVDDKKAAVRIAELMRDEFPLVPVMARAYDRAHAFELIKAGVDYQRREMFDSAMTFGAEALRQLGATAPEIEAVTEAVIERDRLRFDAQLLGGMDAGMDLLLSNASAQAEEAGRKVTAEQVDAELAASGGVAQGAGAER